MRCTVPIAVLVFAVPVSARQDEKPAATIYSIAEQPHFRLRAGAWFSNIDGHFQSGDSIPGTTTELDLQETLGLPSDKAVFSGTIGLDIGSEQRWHIDAGYAGPFKYDGQSGNINISFDGLNYTGVVESHASVDIFEITSLYDLTKPDPVILSVGFGSRIFDFKGSVMGTAFDPNTNTTQVSSSSADAVVPIPGLAAALRWDITPQLNIKGEVQGMYAGNYGNFFDARTEVGFDFTANIGLYAGYRWMHGEADVSDVSFSLNLRGPYAGVEFRF